MPFRFRVTRSTSVSRPGNKAAGGAIPGFFQQGLTLAVRLDQLLFAQLPDEVLDVFQRLGLVDIAACRQRGRGALGPHFDDRGEQCSRVRINGAHIGTHVHETGRPVGPRNPYHIGVQLVTGDVVIAELMAAS